ncbi:MAG: GNAT family N-acetyltransferase [Xanthomonadales bacterium]|nr:GNAT family N-acetyltransferase [Xanthomonadales bacterium]
MPQSDFMLETPRLRLRQFRPGDAEALYRLNTDPDVMRYTGEAPFVDPAAARHFLKHYSYEPEGFGRWAVTLRETGEFMGFCGLKRAEADGDVDLGFRLFRQHWAAGYATEAGKACLQAGFERFGLALITGRVMRENGPSISVLQKLGMTYREMIEADGEFWLIYAVSRERFLDDFLHR